MSEEVKRPVQGGKRIPKRKSANSASIRQPKSTTKTLPNFANTSPKRQDDAPSYDRRLCKHQRFLSDAIKRARVMALLPYKAD